MSLIPHSYYTIKPWIPKWLHRRLRSAIMRHQRARSQNTWPILPSAATPPDNWAGWPDGKRFALVLTHDVESQLGHDTCLDLADIEASRGFCSSFNFVPERYRVEPEVRKNLQEKGFEIGVHGLHHDGKLYRSREIFLQRAKRINHYLHEWDSVGFRSPLMHRDLEWIHDLDVEYDASTFDTDPFEPQPGGAGTIFPFFAKTSGTGKHYVELPYTLAQDSTLFIFMREPSIEIWKKKLAWIAEAGGMALVITHPDYINFESSRSVPNRYPVRFYEELLEHIQTEYRDQYWHALPREIATFWNQRSQQEAAGPS